jgi:hypothetical protein
MPLLEVGSKPGIYRNGSERQCGKLGRYWDQDLTRWIGIYLAPIGGWLKRSTSTVTGVPRAILPWRDSSQVRRILLGTQSGLFNQDSAGAVTDITPVGFVAGSQDESANLGFGVGAYGSGAYGTPRPDTGLVTEASVWEFDTFGQYPVACGAWDGKVYDWDLNTAHKAVAVTNAPTSCLGLLVVNGFLFAFGAGGDATKAQWSTQGDRTVWTPASTNLAGSVNLDTGGKYRRAVKLGAGALILTDIDAHLMTYAGLPSVWRFDRIGGGCGPLSKGCVITNGQIAAWWSSSGFWTCMNGAVQPLPCDVWSYLLQNMNMGQRSKVTAWHNDKFGEFWWHYCSTGSNNVDSTVVWNYRDGWWGKHALARTCGYESGIFANPLACDTSGYVYEHETGNLYDGASPYADSAAWEVGPGDSVMQCSSLIADDLDAGQVTVAVLGRMYPDAAESTLQTATITSAGRTDQRWEARQAKIRVTGAANDDWRVGAMRLDVVAAGPR